MKKSMQSGVLLWSLGQYVGLPLDRQEALVVTIDCQSSRSLYSFSKIFYFSTRALITANRLTTVWPCKHHVVAIPNLLHIFSASSGATSCYFKKALACVRILTYNYTSEIYTHFELLYSVLALCRTPACGAVNSGSTGRKLYIALYREFLFQTGFLQNLLQNRDSEWKIEENNFYWSCNFLSNEYSFCVYF